MRAVDRRCETWLSDGPNGALITAWCKEPTLSTLSEICILWGFCSFSPIAPLHSTPPDKDGACHTAQASWQRRHKHGIARMNEEAA